MDKVYLKEGVIGELYILMEWRFHKRENLYFYII
mgnify:CR=1 FL=1